MSHNPKILIHVSRLHQFDGTSVDVIRQAEGLRRLGYHVFVHARSSSPGVAEKIVSTDDALRIVCEENTFVIAQFAGFDRLLYRIRSATRGKFILRYQNVTPPKWFLPYAWRSFLHAFMGRIQAKIFVVCGKADVLMPASQFSADELFSGVPKGLRPPVVIVPVLANYDSFRAVNQERARAISTPQLQTHTKTALYVSRILPHKGINHLMELLKAWQETQAAKHGIDLNVIVAGKLLPEYVGFLNDLKRQAVLLDVDSKISFRPEVSFAELLGLYQQADIYICSSEHEGFGVPVVEAQCAGVPVVAIDRGATRETLGDGGVCIQGEPMDYNHLAKAVESILTNDTYRAQLVEQGVKNTERFDDDKVLTLIVHALTVAKSNC